MVDAATGYPAAILPDSPTLYWRLGEASGTAAAGASGNGQAAVYAGGVTRAWPGPSCETATRRSPSTAQWLGQVWEQLQQSAGLLDRALVQDCPLTGAKLVGFGNAPTGDSSGYDWPVYMTNAGRFVLGVWTGSAQTISTPTARGGARMRPVHGGGPDARGSTKQPTRGDPHELV